MVRSRCRGSDAGTAMWAGGWGGTPGMRSEGFLREEQPGDLEEIGVTIIGVERILNRCTEEISQ